MNRDVAQVAVVQQRDTDLLQFRVGVGKVGGRVAAHFQLTDVSLAAPPKQRTTEGIVRYALVGDHGVAPVDRHVGLETRPLAHGRIEHPPIDQRGTFKTAGGEGAQYLYRHGGIVSTAVLIFRHHADVPRSRVGAIDRHPVGGVAGVVAVVLELHAGQRYAEGFDFGVNGTFEFDGPLVNEALILPEIILNEERPFPVQRAAHQGVEVVLGGVIPGRDGGAPGDGDGGNGLAHRTWCRRRPAVSERGVGVGTRRPGTFAEALTGGRATVLDVQVQPASAGAFEPDVEVPEVAVLQIGADGNDVGTVLQGLARAEIEEGQGTGIGHADSVGQGHQFGQCLPRIELEGGGDDVERGRAAAATQADGQFLVGADRLGEVTQVKFWWRGYADALADPVGVRTAALIFDDELNDVAPRLVVAVRDGVTRGARSVLEKPRQRRGGVALRVGQASLGIEATTVEGDLVTRAYVDVGNAVFQVGRGARADEVRLHGLAAQHAVNHGSPTLGRRSGVVLEADRQAAARVGGRRPHGNAVGRIVRRGQDDEGGTAGVRPVPDAHFTVDLQVGKDQLDVRSVTGSVGADRDRVGAAGAYVIAAVTAAVEEISAAGRNRTSVGDQKVILRPAFVAQAQGQQNHERNQVKVWHHGIFGNVVEFPCTCVRAKN